MLSLTRRPGDSLTIGEDIVVTVLSITGNQVRLSVDAPGSVPIVRQELLQGLAAPTSTLPAPHLVRRRRIVPPAD